MAEGRWRLLQGAPSYKTAAEKYSLKGATPKFYKYSERLLKS